MPKEILFFSTSPKIEWPMSPHFRWGWFSQLFCPALSNDCFGEGPWRIIDSSLQIPFVSDDPEKRELLIQLSLALKTRQKYTYFHLPISVITSSQFLSRLMAAMIFPRRILSFLDFRSLMSFYPHLSDGLKTVWLCRLPGLLSLLLDVLLRFATSCVERQVCFLTLFSFYIVQIL